ncbi:MAG: TOBE domain-containing protein, partial [Methylotenera sp.]
NHSVSLSIAASNIALSQQRIEGVTIQNQLLGTVVAIQAVEKGMLVTLDIGGLLIAEVSAKAVADMRIEQGAKLYCLIKTQSIHLVTNAN